MKIIVLLKRVPDTEAKILINQEGTGIREDGVKFIINTYDEYGIEEGIKLKEKIGGDSKVTVVCLGPEESTEVIRTALAMGADDAVHICDPALKAPSPFTTAAVLAKAIGEEGFDIIFCGKQGIDDDTAQVQSGLAEMLDIPQVNIAGSFELSEDASKAVVGRRIEGGTEMIETSLPVIVSCDKGLNEPRYASLPGIMKAKKKEIRTRTLADLGFDEAPGAGASRILKWLTLPKGGECRMVEAEEVSDAVKELARLLREEAKII
ncbi:MAG: electron transfer flavoprotein subunit beta/FixA family protein [Candidatus Krumholzibacteriota bacterium]|nr:electron transfer flavoprotein subunit beta/FixA family protein [Candidatus Krumholzibacteriota bacterium]